MDDDIVWEVHPVRTHQSGPRQAMFYDMRHQGFTFLVMLGIDETGHCFLLEHHVKNECISGPYPYRLLPYMRKRGREQGLLAFDSVQEATEHVNERTHEWESAHRHA